MKKMFCVIVSMLFVFGVFAPTAAAVSAAPEVLRVYNWEDYIGLDESGKELWQQAFSDFYAARNGGKTVRVEYSMFGTNEDLFNQMQINKGGYDLVCPSDYMIEKMISKDMLEPLERNKLDIYNENVSPYIEYLFENNGITVNGNQEKWADYAAGYMWGTMGYVYNPLYVSTSDVEHWSAIWNIEYKNKSTLKNSIRDTYFLALGYVYRDELNAAAKKFEYNEISLSDYQEILKDVFNRTDNQTISKVKSALLLASKNIFSFELDEGKNDMVTGKIALNFAWSGDAVASMDNADNDGIELFYSVPNQGSNVWFDGWVIPKNAPNKDLAYEFINFLSQPEIAILNMDEIGYTSVISGGGILQRIKDNYEVQGGEFEYDLSYFFGTDVKIKTDVLGRQFSAQYPSQEVIDRCTVMQNFSDERLAAISAMWDSVKSNPLPVWAIILIVVGALAIGGGVTAFFVLRKKSFSKARRKATVVKKG